MTVSMFRDNENEGAGMKRELLVSLSHVNDPATTTVYPGDPPFELETVATIEKDGHYTRCVRQGEHTGDIEAWESCINRAGAGSPALIYGLLRPP